MSETVSHVAHLLFSGSRGISSAVWMVCLCLWLPILCSGGDVFFSFNNPQGEWPEVGRNRRSNSGAHPTFVLGRDSWSSFGVEDRAFRDEGWRSLTSLPRVIAIRQVRAAILEQCLCSDV